MQEHQAVCEAEGRYVEAKIAANRIQELKEQEYTRQMQEMIFNHE